MDIKKCSLHLWILFTIKKQHMNFSAQMGNNQVLPITETPVTAAGNAAKLVSGPTLSIANDPSNTGPAFQGTVSETPDPTTGAYLVTPKKDTPASADGSVAAIPGDSGLFILTITGEGDPTPGVDTLTDTVAITISDPLAGEAITLGTVVGTPYNQ